MEELFDLCSPEGHPLGTTVSRSRAHREGLWHRSAHLWLLNPSHTQVLLQRRHPGKQTDPHRWDIAVAGHLSAGQTPLEAIVREAHEELGLVLDPTQLVFVTATRKQYVEPGFVDREWQHLFAGTWDGDPSTLVLQPEEVVDARWMSLSAYLDALVSHPDDYVGRLEDWAPVQDEFCR